MWTFESGSSCHGNWVNLRTWGLEQTRDQMTFKGLFLNRAGVWKLTSENWLCSSAPGCRVSALPSLWEGIFKDFHCLWPHHLDLLDPRLFGAQMRQTYIFLGTLRLQDWGRDMVKQGDDVTHTFHILFQSNFPVTVLPHKRAPKRGTHEPDPEYHKSSGSKFCNSAFGDLTYRETTNIGDFCVCVYIYICL